MKGRFVQTALCVLICTIPGVARANEFVESYAFDKFYVSTIPDDAFEKTPAWTEDAENPPLSAKKATKLATEMKDSLVRDEDGYKWRTSSVELRPLDDNPFQPPTEKWFWVVTFWAQNIESGIVAGRPPELRLIVLMDGRVLKPDVREWKRRISK